MIELIPDLPENVVGFSAKGEVTADDYQSVLIPAIEARLKEIGKIRLLYYLGPEFIGFSPGAMWDDTKIGLKHLTTWEKIAVVSDVDWVHAATKLFALAMPGRVKVFTNDQLLDAKRFVTSES